MENAFRSGHWPSHTPPLPHRTEEGHLVDMEHASVVNIPHQPVSYVDIAWRGEEEEGRWRRLWNVE